jgi:excisionase family DNA binding protein
MSAPFLLIGQRMPEKMLTLDELAKYLNVDKITLYRLVTKKKIPAFKVGNQWRFKSEMVEAWLANNSNFNRRPK